MVPVELALQDPRRLARRFLQIGLQEAVQPDHRRDLLVRGGYGGIARELRGGAVRPPPSHLGLLPGEPEEGVLRERVHLDEVALHGQQRVRFDAGQHRDLRAQVRRGGRRRALSSP